MSETLWKWRMYIYMPASALTEKNRRRYGEIFSQNGSLESVENEMRAFDNAGGLSTSGKLPAEAFEVNTAVKEKIRDEVRAFLDGIPGAKYAVVANTHLPDKVDSEHVANNFVAPALPPMGKPLPSEASRALVEKETHWKPIKEQAAIGDGGRIDR